MDFDPLTTQHLIYGKKKKNKFNAEITVSSDSSQLLRFTCFWLE